MSNTDWFTKRLDSTLSSGFDMPFLLKLPKFTFHSPSPTQAKKASIMSASSQEKLIPPFSRNESLLTPSDICHPAVLQHDRALIIPQHDLQTYLNIELRTPKLNKIHSHLWLAGLPIPARSLHRQRLINREIRITERADEHLTWQESQVFIKPMPNYLLVNEFWKEQLCANSELYKSACGFLISYAWLVCHQSDLLIAKETGLLPADTTWEAWTRLVGEILSHIDAFQLHQVDRRYNYGELRLSRLNSIYRLTPSVFSVKNLFYGFMTSPTWSGAFFQRKFAWLLVVFVYVTVVLSAMQVGLATTRLQHEDGFQQTAYGIAIVSMVAVAAAAIIVLLMWTLLFWYHILSTVIFCKDVEMKRAKMKGHFVP